MSKYFVNSEVNIERQEGGGIISFDGKIFVLGDIELEIWDCVEQNLSEEDIVQKMLSLYTGDEQEIKNNILNFLNDMCNKRLIHKE